MKFPASATINESSNNPASFQVPKTAPEGQHLSFSSLVEFGKNMPGGFLVYKAYGSEEIIYINDIVLKLFGCKDLEEFKELTQHFRMIFLADKLDIEVAHLLLREENYMMQLDGRRVM